MKTKKIISVFAAAAVMSGTFAAAAPVSVETVYPFGTLSRQMENLNRGLVAMQTGDGIYLSWRLLSDEDTHFGTGTENITFEIYRDGKLIGTEEDTTNYLDADGTKDSEYYVISSKGDKSETVSAFSSGSNYFDIPIKKPSSVKLADGNTYSYSPNDASVGDLDGDGEYEIILKWDCNGKDNSQSGYTGNVLIDAYKLNGTQLWRIDLGPNIRAGAHYTQFLVYDFDGDGGAEIAMKTAPGSKDGAGTYVNTVSLDSEVQSGDNSKSYVGGGGFITDGPEYYSVFDGDGTVIDTVAYPFPRTHSGGNWGLDSGGRPENTNRVDRFLGGVAFLDGVHPSMITWRGYYAKTTVAAFTLEDGRLVLGSTFNAETNAQYSGQGNHNLTVADVDGDGKDEVICGALALDDDLSVLWSSGRGHGDALHIGDYDPTHPGYEYFSVHESGGYSISGSTNGNNGSPTNYGMTVYDAADGTELGHWSANRDTGRGIMANIGAGGYYQITSLTGTYRSNGGSNFDMGSYGMSQNFRIFWDGDLYDELLDGTSITNWTGSGMSRIFSATGCVAVNGTKNNPAVQADLFGDWREEVVYPTRNGNSLRVFTTNIPTEYKIMTLMHDSVYRSGVAAEQTAYNQPPHIGFYTDDTIFNGPVTKLTITSKPDKTKYNVGDTFEIKGLTVSVVYESGKEAVITDYILDGYNPNAAGTQTITVSYGGASATFEVTVISGFITDGNGIITGYDGDGGTIILPESVDGVTVTGFADGSMKGSGVTHLYIYDSDLTFEGDVFDSTTIVHGYEGSTTQEYCETHGIPFVSMTANISYVAYEDYDKEDFENYIGTLDANGKNFVGNFIVTQDWTPKSTSINRITYGNNPRADAYPDATTGIKAGRDDNNNQYLVPIAGEFSTGGRNSWLEIDEKIDLSTASEYTFAFDILYPTNCGTLVLTLSDGTSTVDSVQLTENMETDTWYTYTYHYDADNRITRTISRGLEVISETEIGTGTNTYGINKIDFTRNANGVNPSTLWGGWGNHGDGACALAYMDNIQVYTPERTVAEFIVTDNYDCPVEGAAVTMADITQITDADGTAEIKAESGTYSVTVSADGYYPAEFEVALSGETMSVPIQLEAVPVKAEKISFEKSDITLAVGGYALAEYSVSPDSADYGITLESTNESVVTIDANGMIHGVTPGTAQITASRDGVSAVCAVTVIDSSDSVPASIVLNGDDTYMPNPLIPGGSINVTASVYDGSGVELYDTPVTFTYTGASDANEYYNSITLVPDGSGDITVTAEVGGISTKKTIQLVKSSLTEHVFASFGGDTIRLVQGKEAQTYNLEGTGITLNVGARGSGGDGRTGFVIANGVLTAQTGRFNNSGRNAFITFDSYPTTSDGDFMFETKLNFAKGNEATVKISDGNNTITVLSPTESGITAGTQYLYSIMYTDGVYTETITNISTGETASKVLSTSAKNISRIDIVNEANAETSVAFDDMRLMSSKDGIITRANVYVYDESGNPVSGALIETTAGTAVTAANGRALVDCYAGVNTFTASLDGTTVVKKASISTGNASVSVKLCDSVSAITLLDGDAPVYFVQNMDFVRFIKAEYDGDILTGAKITDAYFTDGNTLIGIPAGSAEYKVFAWDDNMTPFTRAFGK
ncbi:MAG: bacterial Ig-like domain-containing protein [Oscillospiraceae bacterium]|nr:bacterial Ig-like domain-containing protein [Oscillospiraceae bacterium]